MSTWREWFNERLACGDLPVAQGLYCLEDSILGGCGTKDWERADQSPLLPRWAFLLKCGRCHRWTAAVVEDLWKEIDPEDWRRETMKPGGVMAAGEYEPPLRFPMAKQS